MQLVFKDPLLDRKTGMMKHSTKSQHFTFILTSTRMFALWFNYPIISVFKFQFLGLSGLLFAIKFFNKIFFSKIQRVFAVSYITQMKIFEQTDVKIF